jgi:hypothetical protein
MSDFVKFAEPARTGGKEVETAVFDVDAELEGVSARSWPTSPLASGNSSEVVRVKMSGEQRRRTIAAGRGWQRGAPTAIESSRIVDLEKLR